MGGVGENTSKYFSLSLTSKKGNVDPAVCDEVFFV